MVFGKHIFFGHQSVGNNIIDGIRALPGEGRSLSIIESRTFNQERAPALLHATVGKNRDPLSKIKDFASLMESEMGNKVDIAGLKFCYIDIDRTTNVDNLFTEYKSTMSKLSNRFKNTHFIHFTVPLRTVEPRGRLWIKRLVGKTSILLEDNWNRQQFNEKMRAAYQQSLFDLAKAESTYPSGKRLSYTLRGILVDSLIPEYTFDGGHLNEKGRQIIARQFVDYLRNLKSNTIYNK